MGPFGLMAQGGLRQSFKTIEQGLESSILLRSGTKRGHHFGSEFHIDGFAFGLIRPLEVRSMPRRSARIDHFRSPKSTHTKNTICRGQ